MVFTPKDIHQMELVTSSMLYSKCTSLPKANFDACGGMMCTEEGADEK